MRNHTDEPFHELFSVRFYGLNSDTGSGSYRRVKRPLVSIVLYHDDLNPHTRFRRKSSPGIAFRLRLEDAAILCRSRGGLTALLFS